METIVAPYNTSPVQGVAAHNNNSGAPHLQAAPPVAQGRPGPSVLQCAGQPPAGLLSAAVSSQLTRPLPLTAAAAWCPARNTETQKPLCWLARQETHMRQFLPGSNFFAVVAPGVVAIPGALHVWM